MYGMGDQCLGEKSRRYESSIKYICDPQHDEDDANIYDFP